jgi:hypothetical protein
MPSSGATIAGSIGRTERTGSTTSGMFEWYVATNRLMPPSTTSSQTMSASTRPRRGRASRAFSTFTETAGRCATRSVSTPVSGQTTGSPGLGGPLRSPWTGASTVVTGVGSGSSGLPRPQPASPSSAARATVVPRTAAVRCLVMRPPPPGFGPEPCPEASCVAHILITR